MGEIIIKDFSLKYGQNSLYEGFNLRVEEAKITSILGSSGSGKTSILNAISGLIKYSGEIQNVGSDIAYIFQNQILIPNLSVFANIEYVLFSRIKDKKQRKKVILDILETVNLLEDKDKYPSELSVGMAQRVSMARAFAINSKLILMDEPFRGLDVGIKARLIDYFLLLWLQNKTTCVFVSHNIEEALLVSDKIFVIGNKPVEVLKEITLDSKKETRSMENKEILSAYQEIYTLFRKSL